MTANVASNGLTRFFLVPFLYFAIGSVSHAFDADAAKKTFKRCAACHEVGESAANKVGPTLNGLDGRVLAGIEGYKYSRAMKKAAGDGKTWSAESLSAFLEKPKSYLRGTKMSFPGISRPEERKNLVQWLLHFDADGKELSDRVKFDGNESALLGASAAALDGDPEYGQYLSGECVTCHKTGGDGDGIPTITGWPKENFIHALYEYKQEIRENPVMRTVTKRLGDEEIAALAAYFGSLETQ